MDEPSPEANIFDAPTKFKEHWSKEDEICPHCKQVTKKVRGLTKQNLKSLVFGKPTAEEWIVLLMLICIFFLAYRYNVETQQCRDLVNQFDSLCLQKGYIMPIENRSYVELIPKINFSYTNSNDV